jgi:phage prohead protease, HK97 family
MSKPELIRRSYNFEVRASTDEKGNLIEGRPIVYDSMTDMGWFKEVIERGALDNADLTDVRFLVNHDINKIPLARSRNNNINSTMQLGVDDKGLFIRVYLDVENNAEARALYSAIQRGDITGMSFMFSVDDEEWEDLESEKPTRRIKKISSVVEVSAVTFPAYEDTEIQARNKSELESLRQKLESERQRAKSLERDKKSKLDFETRTLLMMYGGKEKC